MDKASSQVDDMVAESERRFQVMNGTVDAVRRELAAFEGLTVRKLDWVLPQATAELSKYRAGPPPGKGKQQYAIWNSPEFDAGGAVGLQLQLRIFWDSDDA